jgi:hypothetical protein
VVDLGRFGCSGGGGSRKFPNSLMRGIGQIVVVKWAVKFVRAELRGWMRCPGVWCLNQIHWVMR